MQALLLEDDAVLSSEIALFLESKSIKTDKAEDGEKFGKWSTFLTVCKYSFFN